MINLLNQYYRYHSSYDDWRNKMRVCAWWVRKAQYEAGFYVPVKLR